MMYVANVGDCRLVLGELDPATSQVRARRVTRDHTATSHPEEAARLAELKVAVDEEGYHAGVLQVSRSIGDFSTKQALGESVILSTPELHSEALGPDTLFAIACSDGITCAMEDNTMVMLVCQYLNERLASGATNCAQHASRQLVQYAINVKGSDDNASAVVIVFTDLPPPPPLRPKRWRAAPATSSVPAANSKG
ncbi:PPM-type phosphatase domain-containing protein, partial [Haematococcus lacustris]